MKVFNTIYSRRAQKAGSTITPAKSAAARANGKKGGRPKKKANDECKTTDGITVETV